MWDYIWYQHRKEWVSKDYRQGSFLTLFMRTLCFTATALSFDEMHGSLACFSRYGKGIFDIKIQTLVPQFLFFIKSFVRLMQYWQKNFIFSFFSYLFYFFRFYFFQACAFMWDVHVAKKITDTSAFAPAWWLEITQSVHIRAEINIEVIPGPSGPSGV